MANEIHPLRTALRDLVALSTLPAAWAGREPAIIAVGLADVLVRALQLDFAFVRLRDGNGHAPVDVTRGTVWSAFPSWLESHLAGGTRNARKVIPDVGDATARYRGFVMPIGFDAERGLVAVASNRTGFPTEMDQLLLSVATNHAALAFQSAQLVHDLRVAEERLREARDELEARVAERTSELRRTGAQLQTILDASPVGIVLVGGDQTVRRCNVAFERLVGWSESEILGRRIPFTESLEGLGATETDRLELRVPRKDGSEFEASIVCSPLADDTGRAVGLVANVVDIGDRKKAEDALQRARSELAHVTRLTTLGEMAASIAHEINQPLTAIVANATASLNWLAKADVELAMARDALADIVSDGHRAGDVIQRIRQLAKKTDPKTDHLNLNDVIHDVVPLVRGEVQRRRVSLDLALAPTLPVVLGDRVQLQQVIINLVMNGVEAMAAVEDWPREIVIRSEACGDQVAVAVQDAGIGVDPHYVDRLFNAFFTTKPNGMGMGLSISRSIIEGHGGRLWATPNAPHGATFEFTLPAWA